ncbi:MAG: glycoside hydrolase family protein [Planctomycetota bacterium]|jgi:hypothetical protein
MFYLPQHPETGHIWDTWLVLHEDVYYLYYLAATGRDIEDQPWDNISLSTSTDGVHWTEIGPVLTKRPGAVWMGTGSTWKSPNYDTDGKFFMNFSEWAGPRQTIFMAESTDLVNWTRLGDELEFVEDERWYRPCGRWDCIWTIDRPGGGLYGYWTATPLDETGGHFGFGESLDGFTWTALEPPKVCGVDGGEVGAIEKMGDKYVMMFGSGGMYTLLADKPEGPFHMAETNGLLLNGHTYFSRFLATDTDMLVNHHSIRRDGAVFMAPIKRAVMDDAGVVRLAYWPANDALKGDPIAVAAPSEAPAGQAAAMLDTSFDTEQGFILEGDLTLPTDGQQPRGLYIECAPGIGAAILASPDGSVQLGSANADGAGWELTFTEDRKVAFGQPAHFRLLLQHALLEFYLDDILIECFSLPDTATGRLGLIAAGDGSAVGNLAAWKAT